MVLLARDPGSDVDLQGASCVYIDQLGGVRRRGEQGLAQLGGCYTSSFQASLLGQFLTLSDLHELFDILTFGNDWHREASMYTQLRESGMEWPRA